MATLSTLFPYALMVGVTALACWFSWAVNRMDEEEERRRNKNATKRVPRA